MSFLLNPIFNQQHSQYVIQLYLLKSRLVESYKIKNLFPFFLNNHLQIAIDVYVEYRELRCITHP
jgi:hypothetical protein